jgi:hypothetical protein
MSGADRSGRREGVAAKHRVPSLHELASIECALRNRRTRENKLVASARGQPAGSDERGRQIIDAVEWRMAALRGVLSSLGMTICSITSEELRDVSRAAGRPNGRCAIHLQVDVHCADACATMDIAEGRARADAWRVRGVACRVWWSPYLDGRPRDDLWPELAAFDDGLERLTNTLGYADIHDVLYAMRVALRTLAGRHTAADKPAVGAAAT